MLNFIQIELRVVHYRLEELFIIDFSSFCVVCPNYSASFASFWVLMYVYIPSTNWISFMHFSNGLDSLGHRLVNIVHTV